MSGRIYQMLWSDNSIYIGWTSRGVHRWKEHTKVMKKGEHQQLVQEQFDEHGLPEFSWICPGGTDLERYLTFAFRNNPSFNVLNIANGGWEVSMTEDVRSRIAASHKGKSKTDDHAANISKGLLKFYDENPDARQAISDRLVGRSVSEETKTKISSTLKEHFKDPAAKAKQKKAAQGWWSDPEKRARHQRAVAGRKFSEEAKKRMSEAQKRRWARHRELQSQTATCANPTTESESE
jgi:predicted GIY-YIG superfamily endonuclease